MSNMNLQSDAAQLQLKVPFDVDPTMVNLSSEKTLSNKIENRV